MLKGIWSEFRNFKSRSLNYFTFSLCFFFFFFLSKNIFYFSFVFCNVMLIFFLLDSDVFFFIFIQPVCSLVVPLLCLRSSNFKLSLVKLVNVLVESIFRVSNKYVTILNKCIPLKKEQLWHLASFLLKEEINNYILLSTTDCQKQKQSVLQLNQGQRSVENFICS